jgi:peptidoglycan/LPS O-acetylase OafA/YrhL
MAVSAGATSSLASPTTPTSHSRHAPALPLQKDAAKRLGPNAPSTRFLDGMRGLAAFYVLMRHVTWVPAPEDASRLWLAFLQVACKAFYYGHMAVMFFFVLSGFVIHLRYAQKLKEAPQQATFGWGQFVYRRARRLYPPLLAAILLTFIVDRIGAMMGFHWFYAVSNAQFACIPEAISLNHRLPTLLGNLTFLMQMHVPVWGTDSPLWSLAYEWWFYMFYPVLWWCSRRSPWRATAVVGALFLATALPHGHWPLIQFGPAPLHGWSLLALPQRVLAALPTWWCGVLLAEVYVGRIRVSFKTCAWFSFMLVLKFIPGIPEALGNLLVGMGFCGIISLCFHLQQRGVRLTPLDRLKTLGDFSYTLYVTHWPFVIFLTPFWAWYVRYKLPRIVSAPVEFITLIVIPVAIAYVAHLFVERPFTKTQKAKKPAAPAAPTPTPKETPAAGNAVGAAV